MPPHDNAVLRDGPADGTTLHRPDVTAPLEWEDTGGGAVTYAPTGETETVAGSTLSVYRPAR